MIHSNQIYIPIPKIRNTHCKVEIGGVDVTSRVIDSSWILPCTNGIGTFEIKISNSKGQFSGSYNVGDEVKFYADNSDATTLQFLGRIDYIKDDISDQGQYLNIDGRHKAFLLNEYLVCYSAINIGTSTILKAIVDKLPESYGFTYSNVQAESTLMNVEWNYKPFWDCILDLCNFSGHDCYVDNDLDFNYFLENSIENNNDAVVEGDNFIKSNDFGTNDYYEKTRVVAMGQDSGGLPIIYTSIVSTEGDEKREVFIKDNSANTLEKVKDIADAKLTEVTNRNPQAIINSFGLESIKPGENIWIIVPRQKIAGQYKIVQIKHLFGKKSGGWRTEIMTEEEEEGISSKIQSLAKTSQQRMESDNINKFNYSYNFNFDTDSGEHNGTEIKLSVLKTDGSATGTWISPIKENDTAPETFELRTKGETLTGVSFWVSFNGGAIWQNAVPSRLYSVSHIGQDLSIKVIFNSADAQVDSIALLYS